MGYALQTLWYERSRFLPGILAVAFAALLVGLQSGLMLGLFSGASLAVDRTHADLWLGSYRVASVDQGEPIPERYLTRLAAQPEVERCEVFQQGHGAWVKPDGSLELCMIIGSRLDDGALGAVGALTPELRSQLTEPGAVVVDESDLGRLGITEVGAVAEVSERRVRVVGVVRGLRGVANVYVFCSVTTARMLLHRRPEQTTYVLGRCYHPADAARVAARFRDDRHVSVFTSEDFSLQSRWYWLTKTKAGLAMGWTAVLGLLVGAAITGQTLYAATVANLREYALLRAMGIPRWRLVALIAWECLGVGLAGAVLAIPIIYGLAGLAELMGVLMFLPLWLLAGMTVVTVVVALVSGLSTVRVLLTIEPATLLR